MTGRPCWSSHWPLIPAPLAALRRPAYAPWCGTTLTADWHTRYDVIAAVYGHLHIPRTTYHDGVRFEEVSVGYPREWRRRAALPAPARHPRAPRLARLPVPGPPDPDGVRFEEAPSLPRESHRSAALRRCRRRRRRHPSLTRRPLPAGRAAMIAATMSG